jgi:hypothetical protein
VVHSIRMSRTELLDRRPVQCNHNVDCHDATLIDCFYQGYITPTTASQCMWNNENSLQLEFLIRSFFYR